MGADPIDRFSHDAIRLPNGHTMVLGENQRVFPAGTQGSSTPLDIVGSMVIELDENWQVVKSWNTFDHAGGGTQLDINRKAGQIPCTPTMLGCPPVLLPGFSAALDWVHANTLQYLPDGNVLMSLRSQDWVIKIDYAGTGDILWRLGREGDFTMTNPGGDPYPWFSGQHDAGLEDASMQTLSLYDNGSLRVQIFPTGHSRGQVYSIDYANMTVTRLLNADLGFFAPTLGSAQKLPNGDYMFQSGNVVTGIEQTTEINTSGTITHQLQAESPSYRSFRTVDLYHTPRT
jgi:hypothetical protein